MTTYDRLSPIQGPATLTPDQIRDWFRSRNPNAPDDLGQIIVDECNAARSILGDPDGDGILAAGPSEIVVAAQIDEETGSWTSALALEKNNPAGLGAEDDDPYGKAKTFPDRRSGIHAQVAHLLTYVFGADNPWKGDDPRYQPATGSRMFGKARTFADLAGTWATDTGYAEKLAARANLLTAFAANHPDAPVIRPKPITLQIVDRSDWNWQTADNLPHIVMRPVRWFTQHETANTAPTADAIMHSKFVENGGGSQGVSFQWSVDNVRAVQIVDPDQACWHAGDGGQGEGNLHSEASELCNNTVNDPAAWAQAVENAAQLAALRLDARELPTSHYVQHNTWSGKDCPHYLRLWNQWGALVARVQQIRDGIVEPQPVDEIPTHLFFPQTEHQMFGGFLRYWYERGGLAAFGFPLSDEESDGGLTVQWMERVRFEWHPGEFPDDWDVQLTRLGVTRAQQLGYLDASGAAAHPAFATAEPNQYGDADGRYYSETGHNLTRGFRQYWDQFGGLAIFGYPISEEFDVDGLTIQYFERARMEWKDGQWPERFDVTLGRLGAEVSGR